MSATDDAILRSIFDVYDLCDAAGGCLHIVVDDGNMERDDIEWSVRWGRVIESESGNYTFAPACPVCKKCADLLLSVGEEDRERLYCAFHAMSWEQQAALGES